VGPGKGRKREGIREREGNGGEGSEGGMEKGGEGRRRERWPPQSQNRADTLAAVYDDIKKCTRLSLIYLKGAFLAHPV